MFAPHHQRAADEVLRVTRRGGRIGLLSWTPDGFFGQMFRIMRPFAPPPPPGVDPPPLWGDEGHVRALLGHRVTSVEMSRSEVEVSRFAAGTDFRDYFKLHYGPTIAVYRSLAQEGERVAELDAALAELGAAALHDGVMRWGYLVTTATRA